MTIGGTWTGASGNWPPLHQPTERESLESIALALWQIVILLTPQPVPATIVFTDPQGAPVTTVSLTGTETATVPVLVADASGNPITGDVLDPGATVVVSDPTVASAVLSADQTSLAVTGLDVTSTATATVTGTFGGAALTPGVLSIVTTASAPPPPVAAEIVFGTPSAAPVTTGNPTPVASGGHAPEAGGTAPGT